MSQQIALFDTDNKWVKINDNVSLYKGNTIYRVYINGHIWFEYDPDDYFQERLIIVLLYQRDFCNQWELARAFDFHYNTINNWVKRFEEFDVFGLLKMSTTPESQTKVTFKIRNFILSFDYDDPEVTYNYVVKKIKEKFNVEISNTLVGTIVTGKCYNIYPINL